MVIRKKSREDLDNQVKWFFEYAKKIWKISEDKAEEILWILSENNKLSDKNSIRDSLSWKMPSEEFDKIYWEYEDYQKMNFMEIKKYIKEIKLLPEEAKPFINEIVKILIQENWSIENLKAVNINEEDIESIRENLKWNILALKRAIWDKKNLSPKLINIVINWKKENIEAFAKVWIKTTSDFLKLEKLICKGNIIAENIEALRKAWIKESADFEKLNYIILAWKARNIELLSNCGIHKSGDFLTLTELIEYYDTDAMEWKIKLLNTYWIDVTKNFLDWWDVILRWKKENIEALWNAWIRKEDEFIKLQSLISNFRTRAEIIEAFGKIWIKTADEFIKLQYLICNYDTKAENIEIFGKLWIKTADELAKMDELICDRRIRAEILEVFWMVWIKTADELIKLKDIIWDYYTRVDNIESLWKIWVNTADEFLKLEDIIRNYRARAEILEAFGKVWIKTADELIKLKDIICNNSARAENIEAFGKVWIKTADDFLKLEDMIINYNTRPEIIEAFGEVWIQAADDFIKLKNIICDYRARVDNIETLWKFWVKTADDFCVLMMFCKNSSMDLFTKKFEYAHIISSKDRIKILKYMGEENTDSMFVALDKIVRKRWEDFVKIFGENISELLNIFREIWWWEDTILLLYYKWFSVDDIKKYISNCWIYCTNLESLEFLFENFDINIDELIYLKDSFNYAKKENLEVIVKKYEDITLEQLKSLWNVISYSKKENLEVVFKKYPNIGINDLITLESILSYSKKENLEVVFKKYPNIGINDLVPLDLIFSNSKKENLEVIIKKYENITVEQLKSLWNIVSYSKKENLEVVFKKYPNIEINDLISLDLILSNSDKENLEVIFNYYKNISIEDLKSLEGVIKGKQRNLKLILNHYKDTDINELVSLWNVIFNSEEGNLGLIFNSYPNIKAEDLKLLCDILRNLYFKDIFQCFSPLEIEDIKQYEKVFKSSIYLPENTVFKEENHKWYLKYIQQIIEMWGDDYLFEVNKREIVLDILKLPFQDIKNYLYHLSDFCGNKGYSYKQFLNCFDWKSINSKALRFVSKWFDISWAKDTEVEILNDFMNSLYPRLNVKFSEIETEKILWFIEKIWWINKWYSILILTVEKLYRDGIKEKDFNSELCKRIDEYKKIIDMYPEDKIPEWLKISTWIEFEMTNHFLNWYKETTWNDYYDVVNKIVDKAKIGIEREAAYEFATKPATNPMITLLEIHLLQELNLLDINDMQKLWNIKATNYKSRNWTWYHLNIWSDSDMWIDDNIQFIQNLSTIMPRSWISNGENIGRINRYSNLNSKTSKFSVFPNSESKKYVELRTYSVDDVELFEKNVLFNTYAIMWSQAQKKVSKMHSIDFFHSKIINSSINISINNSDDLMYLLEKKQLFFDDQDLKSKKIASEFMFMQISVLRAIDYYNKNFIDNELFGQNLLSNLSDPWKNYFIDFSLSDKRESIWFEDMWQSSLVVKKYAKNLIKTFNVQEYIEKDTPFSDEETKKILKESNNSGIDEKRIPYITRWLNKKLLWEILSKWKDTQELQDVINNKLSNIDRIKNYLRQETSNEKIDRQYLYNYFKTKMSLENYNLYYSINTEFVNRIINLNNFFLKKDDANANGVLQTTILNWNKDEEPDISKSSVFETWYMREWYNYYQWWSENMLLHSVQKIALNYMKNVKNILNTDYPTDTKNLRLDNVA